jgi:O-antigen/teichoic acid export membrane protein
MSRTKRYAASMVSGYTALGMNIVYTLASIPLALHYLDAKNFGLWALIMQVSGYLALVEFGTSTAISRILADHKDDRDSGNYGSVIKTAFAVSVVQAAVIALMGILAAPLIARLLITEIDFRSTFVHLLQVHAVFLALSYGLRPLGFPLWCNNRQDVGNYIISIMFLLMLAFMWGAFHFGFGIWSFVWANSFGLGFSLIATWWVVRRLGLYPAPGCWGKISFKRFWEIFSFSRDIFLMSVGTQLVSASQLLVVSRFLGLEAAAVWSIGTKLYQMAQQMVCRILDYSAPALTEMFVRGERDRYINRFRDLVVLTAASAIFVGLCGSVVNADFVNLWTHGKVQWESRHDVLLAILLFVTTISRCHTCLISMTKEIRGMRYLFLVEGIFFIILSCLFVRQFGLTAILCASILANICCSGVYAIWRNASMIGLTRTTIAFIWIKRPLVCYLFSAASAFLIFNSTRNLHGLTQLVLTASISTLVLGFLMWVVALSPRLRSELMGIFKGYISK